MVTEGRVLHGGALRVGSIFAINRHNIAQPYARIFETIFLLDRIVLLVFGEDLFVHHLIVGIAVAVEAMVDRGR